MNKSTSPSFVSENSRGSIILLGCAGSFYHWLGSAPINASSFCLLFCQISWSSIDSFPSIPLCVTMPVASSELPWCPRNQIQQSHGDQVEFNFVSSGHSVAEGDFNKACDPLNANAFYSGFVNPGVRRLHPFALRMIAKLRPGQAVYHHGQQH